jgi:hypothetical protein
LGHSPTVLKATYLVATGSFFLLKINLQDKLNFDNHFDASLTSAPFGKVFSRFNFFEI